MTLETVGRRFVVALLLGMGMVGDAAAVQVTLNLNQSQSFLSLDGNFGASPFFAQDDPTSPTFPPNDPSNTIVDYDPTQPSNRTTLSGMITVDVDNVLAPTTIRILSANMDATLTGEWLPDFQPDAGATSSGTIPAPAKPADIGIKIVGDFGVPGCCDIAYAVLRDISYDFATLDLEDLDNDIITPVSEPVNPQGEFSSLQQFLSYRTGFFEYWADPSLLNERDRDSVDGDGAPNQYSVDQTQPGDPITPFPNAPKSTYVVSGNVATLTIPVHTKVIDDLTQEVTGQLVATFAIPAGLDGDYNEDGTVNAADYVAWRKLPGTFGGDPAGYDAWRTQFGEPGAGSGGGGSVPEPAAAGLLVVGLTALMLRRGRLDR